MSAVIQSSTPEFRPMSEEDLPGILAIEQRAYAFPWSRGIFDDCLRVGYSCWVLEEERTILAYGVLSIVSGEAHILNLCVDKPYQGQGWGACMLEYLLEIAGKHKSDTIFLEVRPSNHVAKRLYMNAGFDEVGMRRNYYPAKRGREDAVIMARSLDIGD